MHSKMKFIMLGSVSLPQQMRHLISSVNHTTNERRPTKKVPKRYFQSFIYYMQILNMPANMDIQGSFSEIWTRYFYFRPNTYYVQSMLVCVASLNYYLTLAHNCAEFEPIGPRLKSTQRYYKSYLNFFLFSHIVLFLRFGLHLQNIQ